MIPRTADESHIATLDVCLAGVFVAQGERIPHDLYEAWRRRLADLGLDALEPTREAARAERAA